MGPLLRAPMKLEFHASADPYLMGDEIDLRLRGKNGDGDIFLAENPLAFRRLTAADEGVRIEPFLTIRHQEAQSLMDSLWRVGIRPTEGQGSAGQMAAVQSHLADMRAIVADQLGVALPPNVVKP